MTRHAAFHPLRVSTIEPLTDDAVALTFEVPDDLRDAYAWRPGQHLTINCEDGVRRSYSIATSPTSGVMKVGIKRIPGGAFSGAVLDRLVPGDSLEVMTPAGRFSPDAGAGSGPDAGSGQPRSYAAIAAGSGITPVLSIVTSLLESEPEAQVTLLYANRNSGSVMFLDEVHDLKDRFLTRFRVVHVLSREEQEVKLFSGRLDVERMQRMIDAFLPVDSVDEWFLCGPLEMVTSLRDELVSAGAEAVHTELFHAETTPKPRSPEDLADDTGGDADAAKVTVRLDGRSSTFSLARAGAPVLEAALAVRSDAPYACRGGVCGTCRAKVVSGSVEMDTNWALEADEVARGYVLTCQSHPTSDEVVLDYDA